jgi:hypothetical protein
MKAKILVGLLVAAVLVVGGYIAYQLISSRSLSPLQTVTHNYNGLDIKVVYCSPSKRGRLIFGDSLAGALVPHGKYWRLGANDATEITFSKDVKIDGKDLKAGSYRLYAVTGASSWQIAFNSELGKWGYNEPNHDLDVLKVEIPVDKAPTQVEKFTISFSNDSAGVNMNLDWDNAHLRVPISLQ